MADIVAFLLAFLAVLVAAIYKYLTWHYDYWKRLGVDGPEPSLFVGNFPSLFNGRRHIVYDFDDIYSKYKKSKRAIGVFMNRNPEVLIIDPQLAHDVMVTNFRNFHDNLSSKWVGDPSKDKYANRNPFFIKGDSWKPKRTELIGGLTPNRLNMASPIWQGVNKKLTQFLHEQSSNGSVELETKDLAYRYTLAIMCDFLWGIDAATFTKIADIPNTIMAKARVMLTHALATTGLYFQLSIAPFLKRFFNFRFFPEETDSFFAQLTKDAIEMRQKSGIDERADFLNYVMQLQAKKGISHDDAVGHILTGLLDGYETASVVIYHTLFYLANHTKTQERLRNEISQNLGDAEFLNFDQLNSLPFLDQCVHETIRLITPIPIFTRICTQSTTLLFDTNENVNIQPGTLVTIPIFSFHHDADYFQEPYAYKPERFDAVAHAELTKQGVFMPFGDGPRICLGMRMGLFEVKACILEILRSYRISCCSKTMAEKRPDSNSFLLGLAGEFWLKYERL